MDLFTVMEACFSSNIAINGYLTWAVRMMKSPVSTIIDTLKKDNELEAAVMKGKHAEKGWVYKRFFEAVRKNKEAGDNPGEELLAVCLHILSNLPGEPDKKFGIITDDKGAAGKITVLGTRLSDLRNRQISLTWEELAELMIQPNEINIVF